MAVDFDTLLNAPLVAVFGDGDVEGALPWRLYASQSGPGREVEGIFERTQSLVLTGDDGAPQSVRRVTFFLRLAQLPETAWPTAGHVLRKGEKAWQVTEVQPDDSGGALLILGGARGAQGP